MSLIKCRECGQEASDKAESCPKCGAPIAGALDAVAAGAHVKTIEETSKKFKLQTIMSAGLIALGVCVYIATKDNDTGPSSVAAWMILIGFGWYVVNRVRIWWHHK